MPVYLRLTLITPSGWMRFLQSDVTFRRWLLSHSYSDPPLAPERWVISPLFCELLSQPDARSAPVLVDEVYSSDLKRLSNPCSSILSAAQFALR